MGCQKLGTFCEKEGGQCFGMMLKVSHKTDCKTLKAECNNQEL
jgi:hypothetical protein